MNDFRPQNKELETGKAKDASSAEKASGDFVTHRSVAPLTGDVDLTITYLPPVADVSTHPSASEKAQGVSDASKYHFFHGQDKPKDRAG